MLPSLNKVLLYFTLFYIQSLGRQSSFKRGVVEIRRGGGQGDLVPSMYKEFYHQGRMYVCMYDIFPRVTCILVFSRLSEFAQMSFASYINVCLNFVGTNILYS